MKRIVVIGGLSAGPSAAAKARRVDEKCEIILLEKSEHISYATCGLPYALSGVISDREKLMVVKPQLLRDRFNIDVRLREEALEVRPEAHEVVTDKGVLAYDKLVYCGGATAVVPPIEGLQEAGNWSTLRTLEDLDRAKANEQIQKAQTVAVLGAGLIGVEVAENLAHMGKKVVLLEGSPQVLPPWDPEFGVLAGCLMRSHGIEVEEGTLAKGVRVENGRLNAVLTDKGVAWEADYLFVCVGIRPNTRLLTEKGAQALGNGALLINEKMETNLPDIYAAGDCVAVRDRQTGEPSYFPLGTHSNKGGRCAGANAAGAHETFEGAYGTAIIKIFDSAMGRTGMNERACRKRGLDVGTTFVYAPSTPGYYPDGTDEVVKITYDKADGKLLGGEIFGQNGVDKRIDVLATAIYAKLGIRDLPQLDLSYAPPFNTAKDPVVVAGYVASNQSDNAFSSLSCRELADGIAAGTISCILDVRSEKEVDKNGCIIGARNIPLEELRSRIGELDPTKDWVVYCQKGLRGYLACLMLSRSGISKVRNLAGGFLAWSSTLKCPIQNSQQA